MGVVVAAATSSESALDGKLLGVTYRAWLAGILLLVAAAVVAVALRRYLPMVCEVLGTAALRWLGASKVAIYNLNGGDGAKMVPPSNSSGPDPYGGCATCRLAALDPAGNPEAAAALVEERMRLHRQQQQQPPPRYSAAVVTSAPVSIGPMMYPPLSASASSTAKVVTTVPTAPPLPLPASP